MWPVVVGVAALGGYLLFRERWHPPVPKPWRIKQGNRFRTSARPSHNGIDFSKPEHLTPEEWTGHPVDAVAAGVVEFAGWDPSGGGYIVRIRHNDGSRTYYMHLAGFSQRALALGRVDRGDVIGYVGSTGRSTGPHLHFGYKTGGGKGRWTDPAPKLGL